MKKELSKVNYGLIDRKGDKALFGYSTEQMKSNRQVPKSRALADFAPTIILKAKDFATEITIFNTKAKQFKNEPQISVEHVKNNQSVRRTLLERGITPEKLPPEEDVQKLGRKLKLGDVKGLKNFKALDREGDIN